MNNLSTYSTADLVAELKTRRDNLTAEICAVGSLSRFQIIEMLVADSYDLTTEQLHAAKRPSYIARPRQVAMALMVWQGMSRTSIGDYFGLDQSTVTYAVKTVAQAESADPAFATRVQRLKRSVAAVLQTIQISQTSGNLASPAAGFPKPPSTQISD